ncbi:MAG: hypothetical protein EOP11_21600, partial [Proteobacteria bacterium]
MKPEILVLSSSANYIALKLEKDLKDRPFTRLADLEDYIGSERRRKPFLLIMEVANSDDVDRALIAYEWAETVDPQAPARFLILAAKHITFDDRQARLRGLELAFLPVNNRNLLFKVDLQLKLLLSAPAVGAGGGALPSKAPTGFTAEMASLPGRPGRVMVLRGPERGGWKKETAPGAKVRWRWIDEEGAAAAAASADAGVRITWAAESEEEPIREESLAAWVLSGEEADVKAFRNDKELISGRRLLFAKTGEAFEAASKRAAGASPTAGTGPEPVFHESTQAKGLNANPPAKLSGGGYEPANEIELNFKPAGVESASRGGDAPMRKEAEAPASEGHAEKGAHPAGKPKLENAETLPASHLSGALRRTFEAAQKSPEINKNNFTQDFASASQAAKVDAEKMAASPAVKLV